MTSSNFFKSPITPKIGTETKIGTQIGLDLHLCISTSTFVYIYICVYRFGIYICVYLHLCISQITINMWATSPNNYKHMDH